MIFELGKSYIVDVTKKGIVLKEEFDEDRWFDKDHDDLDFLTDKEKIIVVNDVLDKIKAEVIRRDRNVKTVRSDGRCLFTAEEILEIIDNYRRKTG